MFELNESIQKASATKSAIDKEVDSLAKLWTNEKKGNEPTSEGMVAFARQTVEDWIMVRKIHGNQANLYWPPKTNKPGQQKLAVMKQGQPEQVCNHIPSEY